MELSARPWFSTGVALVGAGAIVAAPIAPPPSPAVELRAAVTPVTPEIELSASEIPYILTLPVVRARIGNYIHRWEIYLEGLALSGVGLAESVAGIPEVTAQIIEDIADLNFQDAFNTFVTAVGDGLVAVGEPLVASWVWLNQNAYEVAIGRVAAWPQAIVDVAGAGLDAAGGVVDASFQGADEVIQAILTLNLENIVNAAVEAAQGVIASYGAGAGLIIAGIESAQRVLAEAWMAGPPSPFGTEAPAQTEELDPVAAVPDPASASITLATTGPASDDDGAVEQGPAEADEAAPSADEPAEETTQDATSDLDDPASEVEEPATEGDAAEIPEIEDGIEALDSADVEDEGSENVDVESEGTGLGDLDTDESDTESVLEDLDDTSGEADEDASGGASGAGDSDESADTETTDSESDYSDGTEAAAGADSASQEGGAEANAA